jgi:carbon monoxide dehydrogenase subunit G
VRVEVSRYVFAPSDVVWGVFTDWERQPEWMVDALEVEVVGDQREGAGVRLRCPTRVAGLVVEDLMEVVGWEEERRVEVRHLGRVIRGTGEFRFAPTDVGTRVTWAEEVDAPLGGVGEAGVRLARPYLRHLFGRSLDNLKATCERAARRGRVDDADDGPSRP